MSPVKRASIRKGRKRLAPPWVVLSVGAAILILMFSIFPNSSWFRQLAGGGYKDEADSLKVLLLRNLILKGQGGQGLREDYALQLGLTGNYGEAFAELDTLIAAPGQDSLAALRKMEALLAQRALASHASASLDALARSHLSAALEGFLPLTVPSEELTWAAETAHGLGREDLAYRLYLRLATQDSVRAGDWNLKAARSAMAGRDFPAAGEQYALAVGNLHATGEGKAAALEGLHALQAAERLDLALALGERALSGLASDPQLLAYLVRLARAANQPLVAEKYAEMLVRPDAVAGIEP